MLTFSGTRAYDAQQMMKFIQEREWGLIILDEVHVVPAEMFEKGNVFAFSVHTLISAVVRSC